MDLNNKIKNWLISNNIQFTEDDTEWGLHLKNLRLFIQNTESLSWKSLEDRSLLWKLQKSYIKLRKFMPDYRILYLNNFNELKLTQVTLHINNRVYHEKLNKNSIEIKICNTKTAFEFLNVYHYLGYTTGASYGVFVNNKLNMVCTISNPTRQNIKTSTGIACKELTRLAVIPTAPKNLISFGIANILKLEKLKGTSAIVTFADPTPYRKDQHTGAVYKACNFKFIGDTEKNYCYTDTEGNLTHKKTVYNRGKKLGLKESEYVKSKNLYKVPEWPKLKFEILL